MTSQYSFGDTATFVFPYLDMSDSTQSCPSGFRLYQSGGVRACGRPGSSASCVSVQFPSNGISYSQVCGRVVGYQYGHTDAVTGYHNDINSYYVEGVSISLVGLLVNMSGH